MKWFQSNTYHIYVSFTFLTIFNSFEGKASLAGPDGTVPSKSVECIEYTVQSLDIILSRLKHLDARNMDQLQLFTAVNEAFIEHGFAALPDGILHTFLDYAIGQRNNRIVMLQDHSLLKFSCPKQYRKRYLRAPTEGCLPSGEVNSLVKELADKLANANGPKFLVISSKACKGNEALAKLLSAVNICKAHPRRTTRAKYKEESGYKPVMNDQCLEDPNGKFIFYKNNFIIYRDSDGTNRLLLVDEDIIRSVFYTSQSCHWEAPSGLSGT